MYYFVAPNTWLDKSKLNARFESTFEKNYPSGMMPLKEKLAQKVYEILNHLPVNIQFFLRLCNWWF